MGSAGVQGAGSPLAGPEALAAELLRRPPRLGRTRLVCVDGPSGAGKTVFARRLAAALPGFVPVVHTDDLLAGWDDQFTFWSRLQRRVLAPLRDGRAGGYQAYDWNKGEFRGPVIEIPPAPVVIVEGVSAARGEARAEASFTVFVTAPLRLRLARSAVRDGEAQRPYLEEWRRREDRHFAADETEASVDLVIEANGSGQQRWLPRRAAGGEPEQERARPENPQSAP